MRFAAPDLDDISQSPAPTSQEAWRSPTKNGGPSRPPYTPSVTSVTPRTNLGKRMEAYAESPDSDSEVDRAIDSEEEEEKEDLSYRWEVIQAKINERQNWREGAPPLKVSRKGKERFNAMMEIVENEPNEYEAWVKITEEAAWRQGHQIAHSRRAELREIALNAKAEKKGEQNHQMDQDLADMQKMLKGLAIARTKEEEESRRIFKEREKKLWADIDAAIQRTEGLEMAKRWAEADERKKKADGEELRRYKKEQAAAAVRAEEEQLIRAQAARKIVTDERARVWAAEVAEKTAAEKREAEAAKKAVEASKLAEEVAMKAGDQRSLMGTQWKAWVDKQVIIKENIIEKVKAEPGVRSGLRQGMRLMNRGLGQVINTGQAIVRVTNDISAILNQQLPAPPTAATPIILSASPPLPYLYLLSHLAKSLIKQAQTEVSAKQDAAFPLARIVLGLLMRGHAAFGEILFARFVKKCPWIVPFYPSKRPDQSKAEHEKSSGRSADESLADYVNRMSGISTLYFAILQTSYTSLIPTLPAPPTPDQLLVLIPTPLRSPAAWTWLAYALRDPMPSLPPIAQLLADWIEVCGFEIGRLYGKQHLGKVYEAIRREGIAEGKVKGDSESSRQKLAMLLEGGQQPGEPLGRHWGNGE